MHLLPTYQSPVGTGKLERIAASLRKNASTSMLIFPTLARASTREQANQPGEPSPTPSLRHPQPPLPLNQPCKIVPLTTKTSPRPRHATTGPRTGSASTPQLIASTCMNTPRRALPSSPVVMPLARGISTGQKWSETAPLRETMMVRTHHHPATRMVGGL